MVLQRKKDIILSGTSEEKEVKITFLDREYKVSVNDGRWQISFKIENLVDLIVWFLQMIEIRLY